MAVNVGLIILVLRILEQSSLVYPQRSSWTLPRSTTMKWASPRGLQPRIVWSHHLSRVDHNHDLPWHPAGASLPAAGSHVRLTFSTAHHVRGPALYYTMWRPHITCRAVRITRNNTFNLHIEITSTLFPLPIGQSATNHRARGTGWSFLHSTLRFLIKCCRLYCWAENQTTY